MGNVDSILQIVHFSISVVTPVGSLIRALFVALNIFATSCNDDAFASNPGALTLYGGPIIYLIVQSLVLFLILVYWDSGKSFLSCSRRSSNTSGPENAMTSNDKTSSTETESTDNIIKSSDPIQVLSLRKTYNKYVALDSISLSVRRSEVFALLGPNGAGKSTAVSLIRGDLSPDSRHGGDALVENQSVLNHRAAARTHMGVCPQFDAMDDMTVLEHLVFYAKVRGVSDVHHNVTAIIRAVGLGEFTYRMATKLSGGNKRKLSLAIALVGNPTVLLLDEPSSGMDAIAKRIMWRSLTSVIPGRSLLLTTHSMEEAAALAGRVGILAQRMLAVGEIPTLRRKAGIRYQVHVVMKNAPWTEQGEMQRLRQWLQMNLPGVEIEPRIFHGQMRFTVPMTAPVASLNSSPLAKDRIRGSNKPHENGIAVLFRLLEDNKEQLGLQGYSVNLTTLDQVFLGIVERNNVQEEGVGVPHELVGKEWWRLRWSWT